MTQTQGWETNEVITNRKPEFATRKVTWSFVLLGFEGRQMFPKTYDNSVKHCDRTLNVLSPPTLKCTKRWLPNLREGPWHSKTSEMLKPPFILVHKRQRDERKGSYEPWRPFLQRRSWNSESKLNLLWRTGLQQMPTWHPVPPWKPPLWHFLREPLPPQARGWGPQPPCELGTNVPQVVQSSIRPVA